MQKGSFKHEKNKTHIIITLVYMKVRIFKIFQQYYMYT